VVFHHGDHIHRFTMRFTLSITTPLDKARVDEGIIKQDRIPQSTHRDHEAPWRLIHVRSRLALVVVAVELHAQAF
jgi:hypothetical protein